MPERGVQMLDRSDCHPEQAFFAQREPALSAAEGDLGEPAG